MFFHRISSRRRLTAGAILSALLLAASAQTQPEVVDLSVVHRIRAEALNHSEVMEHLFYLTDVSGPRITNSPGYDAAANWAIKRFDEYGLSNAHKEKWGPFGRGWTFDRFSADLITPQYAPLVGFPLAWSPSTNGPVKAKVIFAPLATAADFEKYKGKLRGAIVLIDPLRASSLEWKPRATRLTDAELEEQTKQVISSALPPSPADARRKRQEAVALRKKKYAFLKDEGAAVIVVTGYRGDGLTLMAQAAGSRLDKEPTTPPAIALAPDHYDRIVRLLEHKIPVEMEVNSQVRFLDTPDSYNVLAEIPGTTKKDEVVMIGAHLDSWQGATGATDNAVGCAVMIEAMRILHKLNLPMARTVRVALWGGEELGLFGSEAYVKDHFADPDTMVLKPEHAKLSAYFNLDYGPGRIRGVYLQSNDMMRPIFEAWLKPFHDLDAKTIAPRNATSTDHIAFDNVGLPGFQFIQDSLEYGVTHHSNLDSYDHTQRADLMQAAAIVAAFAYQAATRPEMLPRKPLPPHRVGGNPYAGIHGVKRDIEYSRPQDAPPLHLDARLPEGAGPFPAAILVHGGGFVGGPRQPLLKPLYLPINNAGIAWFTIDYRVAPAHVFPAAVNDVEAAVRFVREHATEYNVDPNRIALIGDSAGGHLVAYAGASKDKATRVSAVVSFYGPHDFTRNGTERLSQAARTFLGLGAEASADARRRLFEASPVSQVRRGMPPYLLIHGTADKVVPFAQSEEMCARMRSVGASCELIPVPGAGHGLLTWEGHPEQEAYKPKMVEWLRAVLVSGKKHGA